MQKQNQEVGCTVTVITCVHVGSFVILLLGFWCFSFFIYDNNNNNNNNYYYFPSTVHGSFCIPDFNGRTRERINYKNQEGTLKKREREREGNRAIDLSSISDCIRRSQISQGTGILDMENSKGSSNLRNFMCSGKHALLPPKSPFPYVSPSYADYVPSNVIGSKAVQKPREGKINHQRTSSETLLVDEQPSWLDDLLNEPETPVHRGGHRRSSSDSFAYIDVANVSNIGFIAPEESRYKNMMSISSRGFQDFDHHSDTRQTSPYAEMGTTRQKNKAWDSSLNAVVRSSGLPSVRENAVLRSLGSSCSQQEPHGLPSLVCEKQDQVESVPHDLKAPSERKDGSHAKSSASETDTKRAKQQFAQRSRVRKLQYIAELERNVKALQVEGSKVSAELEFLNQQNLILSMENKALKQRLESLAQEQLIKYLEQEVLEREIGRLRALYQQQQQHQQQPSTSHRRSNSRDLDSQFANLSLQHRDTNAGSGPVSGPLHT